MGVAVKDRKNVFTDIRPGPRVRMAARLYASGAVPTKKAACLAVGLHPQYLSMLTSAGNKEVTDLIGAVDRAISDESVSLSKLISMMARKAAGKLNTLIDSPKDDIALKASTEVLDRTPETSKTMKVQTTNWNLDGDDARDLAKALVEGARVKAQHAAIAAGDFVRVDTDKESDNGKEKEGQVRQRAGSGQGDSAGVEVEVLRSDRGSSSGLPKAEGRAEE